HRCIPQHASAPFRKLLSPANSEYAVHDGHLHSHVHRNSEAPRSPHEASARLPRYRNRSEDGHAPVRGVSGNPREGSSNLRWCPQPCAPHNLLRARQRATLFEDERGFGNSRSKVERVVLNASAKLLRLCHPIFLRLQRLLEPSSSEKPIHPCTHVCLPLFQLLVHFCEGVDSKFQIFARMRC